MNREIFVVAIFFLSVLLATAPCLGTNSEYSGPLEDNINQSKRTLFGVAQFSTKGILFLEKKLKEEFFGQHLALETTIIALDAHIRDANPGKALVLSFHGLAGTGKTYLVEHIAKALYAMGMQSPCIKMYVASLDFDDETKMTEYKKRIRMDIKTTVKECEHAMFVFDEADQTPPKLLDTIVPFLDHSKLIDGHSYKKSIFIFMSNIGASAITTVTLRGWVDKRKREELLRSEYEEHLSKEAFNNKENGFYHTRLIEKGLVDYFIPFLPLEQIHVVQCAKLEGKRQNKQVDAWEVADNLTYWPPTLQLYSQSGCRKVEAAVKYQLSHKLFDDPMYIGIPKNDYKRNTFRNATIGILENVFLFVTLKTCPRPKIPVPRIPAQKSFRKKLSVLKTTH